MFKVRKMRNFGDIKKIELNKAIAGNDMLIVTYKNNKKFVFVPSRQEYH